MATWKKVIVSGSNASLNQITASIVSASQFTGSLLGSSSYATSGAFAITASYALNAPNATSATQVAITDVPSTNATYYVTFVDGTTGNRAVSTDSSTFTYNPATNGLTLTQITASIVSASSGFTGSLLGTASAAGTASWASNVAGGYVSSFIGRTGAITLTANDITGAAANIVSASSLTTTTAQGEVTQSINNQQTNYKLLNLGVNDTPTFASIGTNASTFTIATSNATGITIGGTTATVTIPGNLNVQGATTIISSSNLTVKDQFVFIASGSTQATNEGGIIVSNASNQTGSAIFYDGTDTRWGLAPAVGATDTGATANSYIVSVSGSSADPTGNPTYGGSALGYGNMSINTTSGDIWIYV